MAFKFVTPEGYQLIKKEFDEIWENIRPNVVEKLAWAASLGDRSENADYQYNKQLLRQIDRRVKFLTDTLKNTEILDRSADGIRDNKVYFGAYVEIENDDGDILHVHIVNTAEVYGRKGFISYESPIARGILNKTIDDDAEVITPKGKVTWYINKISYTHDEWFGPIDEPQFNFSGDHEYAPVEILSDEELKKIKDEYLKTLVK